MKADVLYRIELLSKEKIGGFNAARLAVENKDEKMMDLLVQYMTYSQLTKTATCDGLCVIQRAAQVNPSWFEKFKSHHPEPRIKRKEEETMLSMMIEVEDIDNQEKYPELWERFQMMSLATAVSFIKKSLTKCHVMLPLKMLEKFGSSIQFQNPVDLEVLVRLSVQFKNEGFFEETLKLLAKDVSIFHWVVKGKQSFIDIFFASGRSITLKDVDFCIHSRAVGSWDVRYVLEKDPFFCENIKVPGCVSTCKFAQLLEAGFFMKLEKIFLRSSPLAKLPGSQLPLGVPTLGALGTVAYRDCLLVQHKKNLRYLSQHELSDLPDLVRNQITGPFTKAEAAKIRELFDLRS